MAAWNDAIEEARTVLHNIEALLSHQTDLLNQVANIPPHATPVDHMLILGAPELRNFKLGENVTKLFIAPYPGIYTKLIHWAWMSAEKSTTALFVGPVGKENLTLAQALADASLQVIDGNGTENISLAGNPRELIIPPDNAIYGIMSKPGEMSVSTARYQLTV